MKVNAETQTQYAGGFDIANTITQYYQLVFPTNVIYARSSFYPNEGSQGAAISLGIMQKKKWYQYDELLIKDDFWVRFGIGNDQYEIFDVILPTIDDRLAESIRTMHPFLTPPQTTGFNEMRLYGNQNVAHKMQHLEYRHKMGGL